MHVLPCRALALGPMRDLGIAYHVGLAISAGSLAYEHWLVRPDDLSKLGMAFFNVNGYLAVVLFVFTYLGLYI